MENWDLARVNAFDFLSGNEAPREYGRSDESPNLGAAVVDGWRDRRTSFNNIITFAPRLHTRLSVKRVLS